MLSGCELNFLQKRTKPKGLLFDENFASERVVNLVSVKKVTGQKNLFLFHLSKTSTFLEGYIQGMVTDYEGRPVQGIVVRAAGEGSVSAPKKSEYQENASPDEFQGFDPGITDSAGLYQIRFSLPMVNGRIDMRGRLIYNPGWEQQLTSLGQSYQPQISESTFRFYYDRRTGIVGFDEGLRRVIVRSSKDDSAPKMPTLPGGVPRPTSPPPSSSKPPADNTDDLFKGFGFGQ